MRWAILGLAWLVLMPVSPVFSAEVFSAAVFAAEVVAAEAPAHGTLSLTLENDVTSGTDRGYTAGARGAFVSSAVPGNTMLGRLDGGLDRIFGAGDLRWTASVQQLIFTPAALAPVIPNPLDRPYAGVLTGKLGLLRNDAISMTHLAAEFGVIGPDSGAEQVQNNFHALIGGRPANGWGSQLPSRGVFGLVIDQRWRIALPAFRGLEAEVIPAVGGNLTTLNVNLAGGAMVRIGRGLQADFGPPRMQPGLAAAPVVLEVPEGLAWYAFLGVQGRLVGVDQTLDGYAGRGVQRQNGIAEAEAGVAFFWRGMRLSLTQVVRSSEFFGQGAVSALGNKQRGGPVSFGSVTLAVPF
jgi:hypothetical protein